MSKYTQAAIWNLLRQFMFCSVTAVTDRVHNVSVVPCNTSFLVCIFCLYTLLANSKWLNTHLLFRSWFWLWTTLIAIFQLVFVFIYFNIKYLIFYLLCMQPNDGFHLNRNMSSSTWYIYIYIYLFIYLCWLLTDSQHK